MLVPMLYYYFTKKQGNKWDTVGPADPSGFKLIFILLAKTIATNIQVTIIEIKELSFEELFARTNSVILF